MLYITNPGIISHQDENSSLQDVELTKSPSKELKEEPVKEKIKDTKDMFVIFENSF